MILNDHLSHTRAAILQSTAFCFNGDMAYTEDQLLPISGLQHLVFCKRQCALIHLECQWRDNLATIQGQILHKNAHKPGARKSGLDHISRSLPIHSLELGLFGYMDLLIQTTSDTGQAIMVPREFKRGRPKKSPCDRIQLCAQAMSLEEMMLSADNLDTVPLINSGDIFYGKMRRLVKVEFTQELRNLTKLYALEFHNLFASKRTPPPEFGPKCKKCSLKELCLPELQDKFQSVGQYLRGNWMSCE